MTEFWRWIVIGEKENLAAMTAIGVTAAVLGLIAFVVEVQGYPPVVFWNLAFFSIAWSLVLSLLVVTEAVR